MSQPTKEKEIQVGSIKHLHLDIDAPVKFKLLELEPKGISLYVGANGTGKTFVLVAFYSMTMAASIVVNGIKVGLTNDEMCVGMQYIFDNCYTDQNINGNMGIEFTSGSRLNVAFVHGKVSDVQYIDLTAHHVIPPPRFMSSNMRKFDSMHSYLKMRKMIIDADPSKNSELIYPEMIKHFKMYDVMHVERLIHLMPVKFESMHLNYLKGFDYEENVLFMDVDLDKCRFYIAIDREDNIVWMDSLGAGHQSIFNMLLGST